MPLDTSPKVIVAQLGARMHYAVPRILDSAGKLQRLYTDIAAPPALARLAQFPHLPSVVRRLAGRWPEDLPAARVRAFPGFALEYLIRRRLARRIEQHVAVHLWAGTEFCRRVLAAGVDGAAAIYGFNSASLELLQYARRKGIFGIVEQTIAPALLQSELLAAENEAYPAWRDSGAAGPAVQRFAEHEKAEWEASSLIVCASEFVRQGIAAFGGPAGRCAVVPYGVDWKCPPVVRSAPHQPLRVLTVGAVGLRKGSPYVFQAAKLSKSFAVFRMAGALAAPSAARQEAPANVELPGPIPRAAIASEYDWADVFLLPSLCEGSATATYEALAAGLPVIATPNTGSVVRDGVDGFIVPIRDPQAIAARLDQLASSPQLFAALAANARRRAAEYTIPRYGERLLAAIEAAGCPLEIAVVQD